MIDKSLLKTAIERYSLIKYGKEIGEVKDYEAFNAISLALLEQVIPDWRGTIALYSKGKQAFYISAEYLMGRALGNNLMALGVEQEVKDILEQYHLSLNTVEEIEEDAGLGNGGLGRLAACLMDSAATMHLPVQGYGLRYENGLFSQKIVEGKQVELADTWLKYGDPWSIRKEDESIIVSFEDYSVKAIPYDTPIIGYHSKNINTLRLWKCEPITPFNYKLFCEQRYDEALSIKNEVENITRVLYPADSMEKGKLLRLRQQYFMVSASLKDCIRQFKKSGHTIREFASYHAIQLNDTHPVLAVPELIRLLIEEEDLSFTESLQIARQTFSYTNHTILAEALEKWDIQLMKKIVPIVYHVIELIDQHFIKELKEKGYTDTEVRSYQIISGHEVKMAHLAIYMTHTINGVAQLHTDILKQTELHHWYTLFPHKFQNKTNGITPRRWLKHCNKELSAFITGLLGNEDWVTHLSNLSQLEAFKDNTKVLEQFQQIKKLKKIQLARYIEQVEGITINPCTLFDIQVKRLHEYKRQLLNAFYILDLYYDLKENPTKDIPATTFILGAKAFPSYRRAKTIIQFIGAVSQLINSDPIISQKIKLVFIQNYNVSYGEKLFPAADVSKQISTAGKEASGTGNMKFMLNGAVTFGTYDGANVEIVKEAGDENNFIFGLRVEEINALKKTYNGRAVVESNAHLKRVVNTLIDGTFNDGGTGDFEDLYNSLLKEKDSYFVLQDFEDFKKNQERVFKAYKDKETWAKMGLMNVAHAGNFSSDRTIMEYAQDIWHIERRDYC